MRGRARVRFAGYAAVFDRADNGGDVIRAGAFQASLQRGAQVPLLWQHRTGKVVGRIEQLREDRRGLQVIGELTAGEEAARLAPMLRQGRLNGLSFGYRVRKSERRNGLRELIELDLVEVSLVSNPMQPLARVHAVAD